MRGSLTAEVSKPPCAQRDSETLWLQTRHLRGCLLQTEFLLLKRLYASLLQLNKWWSVCRKRAETSHMFPCSELSWVDVCSWRDKAGCPRGLSLAYNTGRIWLYEQVWKTPYKNWLLLDKSKNTMDLGCIFPFPHVIFSFTQCCIFYSRVCFFIQPFSIRHCKCNMTHVMLCFIEEMCNNSPCVFVFLVFLCVCFVTLTKELCAACMRLCV